MFNLIMKSPIDWANSIKLVRPLINCLSDFITGNKMINTTNKLNWSNKSNNWFTSQIFKWNVQTGPSSSNPSWTGNLAKDQTIDSAIRRLLRFETDMPMIALTKQMMVTFQFVWSMEADQIKENCCWVTTTSNFKTDGFNNGRWLIS